MMDQTIVRVSESKWVVIDDEGNRFVHGGTGYTHLQIGESEPYETRGFNSFRPKPKTRYFR
jgi:hypothetical protein